MSILLDDREDQTLASHLSRFGLPISVVRLDYGDLVIGAENGWTIGYERKRVTDLIASIENRRLSGHQLKGMRETYDRVELVIEGLWRPGETGAIEVMNGGGWRPLFYRGSGIDYRQVDGYLYSQYEMAGVPCWRTGSTYETACLYASRWHWWQKDYDLHKSHDVLYTNDPSAQHRGAVTLHQGEPNLVTLMAAQLPGVDAKSWDVGKYFGSPQEMCNAGPHEWRQVPWTDRRGNVKHFGKDTALALTKALRGEKQQ